MGIDFVDTDNEDLVIPDDDNSYYRKKDELEPPNNWMMKSGDFSPVIIDENKKHADPIEKLRKIGQSLNPKHGDKLYPLEVLGAYSVVYNKPLSWDFNNLGYNPEKFVDDNIVKWLNKCDINKFKNRLERELSENTIVKNLFLLRLNYAILLEESTDSITIHTRPKHNSFNYYGGIPEEGCDQEVVGNHESAKDLMEDIEELDKIADQFYSKVDTIKTTQNGTPQNLVEVIKQLLISYNYDIDYDLDAVYKRLNEESKLNLEFGLVARIGYLALKSEIEGSFLLGNPRIQKTD